MDMRSGNGYRRLDGLLLASLGVPVWSVYGPSSTRTGPVMTYRGILFWLGRRKKSRELTSSLGEAA